MAHLGFRAPLLIGLLLVVTGLAYPSRALEVILIRHGHKDVARRDFNLSPQGFKRSLELATMIPGCFGAPSRLISYPLNPLTNKNARSYQTLVPLAAASGVNIEMNQDAIEHSEAVGQQLRIQLAALPERVVIAWEHRRLPDLARGLGWAAMASIANEDFDQLFVLRFEGASSPPVVQHYSQSELLQQPCFKSRPTTP